MLARCRGEAQWRGACEIRCSGEVHARYAGQARGLAWAVAHVMNAQLTARHVLRELRGVLELSCERRAVHGVAADAKRGARATRPQVLGGGGLVLVLQATVA